MAEHVEPCGELKVLKAQHDQLREDYDLHVASQETTLEKIFAKLDNLGKLPPAWVLPVIGVLTTLVGLLAGIVGMLAK